MRTLLYFDILRFPLCTIISWLCIRYLDHLGGSYLDALISIDLFLLRLVILVSF